MKHTTASSRDDANSPIEPQQAFLELGRLDLTTMPLGEVLSRVAALAEAAVPGADEVSVTLLEGEKARSVAFTGALAAQLDERQYDQGFGPCLHAAITGDVITIADTDNDDRYADFAAIASRAGVRSTLSVGMPVPQRVIGGLNFYSGEPDAFDQAAVDLAQAFASYGAIALVNAATMDSKTTLATHLERAMASRAVIEQAKGILMARMGLDADQAFAELTRRSQNANRKLNLMAADLVAEVRKA